MGTLMRGLISLSLPISVDGYEVEFDQHKIQFHAIVDDDNNDRRDFSS